MDDELDRKVVQEIYDKLHALVGDYMHEGLGPEAFESLTLLFATSIVAYCKLCSSNIEQHMEDAFDSTADYVYGILEDKDEN